MDRQEITELLARLRGRVGSLVRHGATETKALSDSAMRELDRGVQLGKETIRRGADEAWQLATVGGQRLQAIWAPEDIDEVLGDSTLFGVLEAGADAPGTQRLSIPWRNDVLLGLSVAGLLSLEEEIIGTTNSLFHEGVGHQALSERLFGYDYDSLHKWIDTVPGSSVAGGYGHRVHHGHTIEVIPEIYRNEGLEGVLVWAQHVGQDVFSNHGVPALKGDELAGWIEAQGLAKRGEALMLVSFNAVELAAMFLSFAFALRLAGWIGELQRRRKVKKRCKAADRAREAGDLDGVIANYAKALALSGNDSMIAMALGWTYMQLDRPAAESFLYFRRAAEDLAIEDRLVELQGVTVSLRGIAYLLSLVGAQQVLGDEARGVGWREELERMVRGAVSSFELAAISQLDRPSVSFGDREFSWRPRPLSGAANYYLAARTVAAAPFTEAYHQLSRLQDSATEALENAAARVEGDDQRRQVESVADRWACELAIV